MKILYLINGLGFSDNTGIGGADKRAVEIARQSNQFSVLTTASGYNLFKNNEGLDTTYYTINQPSFWPKGINKNLIGRMLSYIYATFASLTYASKVKNYDMYFPSSDFFFDVIPAYFFKLANHKKLVCVIHHHIQNPFKRKGPLLVNMLLFLLQQLSIIFLKVTAEAIFLYDTPEGHYIAENLLKSYKGKIFFMKNGISVEAIDSVPTQEKIYDACFVGGIRPSKGIADFVKIWKSVTAEIPKAKFAVIGGGSEENVNKLKEEIYQAGLQENIILFGPLSGSAVYKILKQSKVFMSPSYEEGWGIAVCEAMYCELPIVCYDLPAYKVFGTGLKKVEVGNYEEFAKNILALLKDPKMSSEIGIQLKNIAGNFTWKNIAKEDSEFLSQILQGTIIV